MKRPLEPEITPLGPADAAEIAALLQAASPGYSAHFQPFAFDEETVRGQLERARRDRWWGVRTGGKVVGFWMLRGFDEGYERPAFGVFIAERFAGRGLARRALDEATRWCEANGVPEMMLTVSPANTAARRVYDEAGFTVESADEKRVVMKKRLKS